VGKKQLTRREKFLARPEAVLPWAKLLAVIAPHYPKGARSRPPLGLARMLRVNLLQQWYGLADEALEDALYDRQVLRSFARLDLGTAGVPDGSKESRPSHREPEAARSRVPRAGAAAPAQRPGTGAGSGRKPMAASAGAISGLAMKFFQTSPVRWFSIITTIGAWFSAM